VGTAKKGKGVATAAVAQIAPTKRSKSTK